MLRDTLAHLWGTVSGSRRRAEEAEAKQRAEQAEAKRRAEVEATTQTPRQGRPLIILNDFTTRQKQQTPLHEASKGGYTDAAKQLLLERVDVNARDIDGATPLIVAAENGHREFVELLLTKGADVQAKNDGGQTALHVAAIVGQDDIAKLLLASKADINAQDTKGNTPLHYAAVHDRAALTILLLDNGAKIEAKNKQGCWTPLLMAASNGHVEIVKLLLSRNAKVGAQDDTGWTALHLAAEHGHEKVAEVLLANHAKVDPVALIIGAVHGRTKVVELLLANGANANAKDDRNRTAMDYAADSGHKDIVELLRQHSLRNGQRNRPHPTGNRTRQRSRRQHGGKIRVSSNRKELAAMDQNDLPKEFFVPTAMSKSGMSGSPAQFVDEKGVRHIPIFRTHELGSAWVARTKEQWKGANGWDHPSRRVMLEHGSILLEKETPSNMSFGEAKYLDLEPEPGKLFAPPDRQVLVGS